MIDISIVIVNYKVKEYIIPCIESIYKNISNDSSFEIIIVDNNSNDKSVENIRKLFPEVTIIENERNIGFGPASNQGSKKAMGKFLFFLNPDTIIIEDCLPKLLSFSIRQKDLGIIGPGIISEARKLQQSFWRKPTILNTILSLINADRLNYNKNYKKEGNKKIMVVDSLSGCAMFISSKIFDELKGFNPNLFWMEDIDLCYRAQKLGYNNYYFPETKIIHYQGKSAEKNWEIVIKNQLLSKIKFFIIHFSNKEAFILKIFIIIISIIKILAFIFILPFNYNKYHQKLSGYSITVRSILFNN